MKGERMSSTRRADDKSDHFYFSGWLAEINPATHTFAVRNGHKLLQFTTIVSRTDISVDGRFSLQDSLKQARIGDAVMGRVSLAEARPYVEWLEFTHKPAYALPLKSKPGFVPSPYNPIATFDARTSSRGDMVLDDLTEKIFLIP